jgi:membrane-bound lytic murein transglycosylase B
VQAAVSVVAALMASLAAFLGGGGDHPRISPRPAAATGVTGQPLPADPVGLAATLSEAQRTIDDPASSAAELRAAGQDQQLATVVLARGSAAPRRSVLHQLSGAAAATLGANLTAAAALQRLNQPRKSLPPWRIAPAPAPATLLGYFKSAQARYGVPWQYLASIELIESDFGRVVGLSTAGAEGPMQFMPATWAAYGRGDVHNQRDAIFAAARYLTANGAPSNMPGAIYHYNLSRDYVAAVSAYAGRMAADPRAFYGYYNWQVILARVSGLEILPIGFPRLHAVPLRRAGLG